MKKLGYGVIGCGYFGAELARTMNSIEGAKVVAAYSPGQGAKRVSAELGCDVEETVDKLVSRNDIQAVIIASPNNMHKEHVLKAAKAGKHIFCEKPFALNVEDADEMINACRDEGVTLMVGHIMHYFEGIMKVKKMIEHGVIGKPLTAHAERTGWEPQQQSVSWKKMQNISGGHLFHHIHEIDLMQWYMGAAKEVYTVGGNLAHAGEYYGDEDDVLLLTIKFHNGSYGTMQYGSGFRLGEHFIKINGMEGAVLISFKDAKLFLHKDGKVEEMPLFGSKEGEEDILALFKKTDGGISYGKPTERPPRYIIEGVMGELGDFHAVLGGAPVPEDKKDLFDGSSARESVAIAAAALESKAQGTTASVR